MDRLWGVALVSGAISILAVGLVKRRFQWQLLDIPNERSTHTQPTPRGGGLGFILAFAIAHGLSVLLGIFAPTSLLLWAVLLPLAVIGFIDDRQDLSAKIRYLVQLGVSSLAVWLYAPFPQPWLEHWGLAGQALAIALTIIGMTAIINFYNFMDGLDGLVAGTTAIQLIFLALYLHQPLNGLLVAALLGFLYWNWSPAKIFMGDVGSTVLGAFVAIALLSHQENPAEAWSALTLTLPLIGDTIYTLGYRLWRGENIFQAHRCHIFQRLQQSGWSHAQVATLYMAFTSLIGVALNWEGTGGAWFSLAAVMVAVAIAHFSLPMPPPKLTTIPSNANQPLC